MQNLARPQEGTLQLESSEGLLVCYYGARIMIICTLTNV